MEDFCRLLPLLPVTCQVCGERVGLWQVTMINQTLCNRCVYRLLEHLHSEQALSREALSVLVLDYARVVFPEHVSWCTWCRRQDIALSWRVDHLLDETLLAPFYDNAYMSHEMLAQLAGLPQDVQEVEA